MPPPILPLENLLPLILAHSTPPTRATCCLLSPSHLPTPRRALESHLVFTFDPAARYAAVIYRCRRKSVQPLGRMNEASEGLLKRLREGAGIGSGGEESGGEAAARKGPLRAINPPGVRIVEVHLPPRRRDEVEEAYQADASRYGDFYKFNTLGGELEDIFCCFSSFSGGVDELRISGAWKANEVQEVLVHSRGGGIRLLDRRVAEGKEGRKPRGLRKLVVERVEERDEENVDVEAMKEEAEAVGVELAWEWEAGEGGENV